MMILMIIKNKKITSKQLLLTTIIIGVISAISLSSLISGTAMIQPSPVVGSKEFASAWESNEKIALMKVKSNPEIIEYTTGAIAVDQEFYPAALVEDNMDRAYVHVYKNRDVVGDWQTSYTIIYSGHYEIEADFVEGQITKVNVTHAPDEIFNITFSDEEKSWIEQSLQNTSVQKLLSDKNWYVRHIHTTATFGNECPYGDCRFINIDQNDKNESLDIKFNAATKKVVSVIPTSGWDK